MKTLTTAQKFLTNLIADLEARGEHKAAEHYRNSAPMLELAKAEQREAAVEAYEAFLFSKSKEVAFGILARCIGETEAQLAKQTWETLLTACSIDPCS